MDTLDPTISPLSKGYQLHQSQRINATKSNVFEFFADPNNLERITPERLKFQVKDYAPRPIEAGSKIRYELKVRGVPISWVSNIKAYEPGEFFIDEMIEGPYEKWEHIHTFETRGDSTLVGDQVYYTLPYGILGSIAHKLFVKRDLLHIFKYRQKKLDEIFHDESSDLEG